MIFIRIKRFIFDLQNHHTIRKFIAILILFNAYLMSLFNKCKYYQLLMKSHRTTLNIEIRKLIENKIKEIILNSKGSTFLYDNFESISGSIIDNVEAQILKRTLVLKNPKYKNDMLIEKGVLYVMFTSTTKALYSYYNILDLIHAYTLVIEPSWSGYCDPDILFLANISSDPVFIGATEKSDFTFLERLNSNLHPLNFGSSNWVDYNVFKPLKLNKEYDAIMVAVWAIYKRHHILFKAISKLKDETFKIALVGVPYKGTLEEIKKLISYYKIENNIVIFENLSPKEVNVLLNKSKVNILLSKKEGSNRSIFEGFFANIPGIVLRDNIGVNKDYINILTGSLISDKELPSTLIFYQKNFHRYKVREWALKNISFDKTTESLNNEIKNHEILNGRQWTEDIATKVNCPELVYLDRNNYNNYLNPLKLMTKI
jgi:glycosyltransferase involved in cell wall biosynthesis